ncbi:hypothetical protein AB0E10_43400 [Streptomyces sp. NPDC048045]|uniref:hypothetical protein n=1 Tax=Streptomyces sp. NPDC048045 TaxID=3154710 RepID=UPI00344A9193
MADDLIGLLSQIASGLCVSLLPEPLRDLPIPGVSFASLQGRSPLLEAMLVAVRRPDAAVLRLLDLITRHAST